MGEAFICFWRFIRSWYWFHTATDELYIWRDFKGVCGYNSCSQQQDTWLERIRNKSRKNSCSDPADLEKAYENFESGIEKVVFHFALCGTAFFIFGFIQVRFQRVIKTRQVFSLLF